MRSYSIDCPQGYASHDDLLLRNRGRGAARDCQPFIHELEDIFGCVLTAVLPKTVPGMSTVGRRRDSDPLHLTMV
jgi:hypothetical protein